MTYPTPRSASTLAVPPSPAPLPRWLAAKRHTRRYSAMTPGTGCCNKASSCSIASLRTAAFAFAALVPPSRFSSIGCWPPAVILSLTSTPLVNRTAHPVCWNERPPRHDIQKRAGISALDPQLVSYSWMTGIDGVAQVVFVRKRLEVQYLRATISDEQRQELPVSPTGPVTVRDSRLCRAGQREGRSGRRSRLLPPEPSGASSAGEEPTGVESLNRYLRSCCQQDEQRQIAGKPMLVGEAMRIEREHLLPRRRKDSNWRRLVSRPWMVRAA